MRDTQFIGLTNAAEEFVKDLPPLPSCTEVAGMFDEKIPLRRWEMHPVLAEQYSHRKGYIEEVVQEVPWSSGPMIFTHLVLVWDEDEDNLQQKCFEWVHDPNLSSAFCQHRVDKEWKKDYGDTPCRVHITGGEEFDEEKGIMWV